MTKNLILGSLFHCFASCCCMGVLLGGLAGCASKETQTGPQLVLELVDSLTVNEVGNLQLADRHPRTGQFLVYDPSQKRILITGPQGEVQHRIELAKDEATSYARRGLYNLAFYGDSMVVFTNMSGLFIVQPNGKVLRHLVDTINRSPNYQYDIANFKTGTNDYFLSVVKYARRKRTPTVSMVMSREYATNFRSVTVFDLARNRSEVIIPLEPDSELLTGEYYYEDRQAFFSADTAQRKIYLMHNPEPKVYAYDFIDGQATLASTFPLAPDHLARRFQVKFDQGRFDNLKYVLVNASHNTFRVKGDSCLVGYYSGMPEEDYNAVLSREVNQKAFAAKSLSYLGLYVKGKKVASDFQVPAYIGKLAHWSPGGLLYFQTDNAVRENENSTTFYAFRLVVR